MSSPSHRRTSTCALVLLGTLQAFLANGQTAKQACNDSAPTNCATAKFLGEDKACSCFVCNPESKIRKVVCTQSDAEKKKLFKIVQTQTPK